MISLKSLKDTKKVQKIKNIRFKSLVVNGLKFTYFSSSLALFSLSVSLSICGLSNICYLEVHWQDSSSFGRKSSIWMDLHGLLVSRHSCTSFHNKWSCWILPTRGMNNGWSGARNQKQKSIRGCGWWDS